MQRVYGIIPLLGALTFATSLATAQISEKAAGTAQTGQERSFKKDPRLDLDAAQERTVYQSAVNADRQSLPQGTPLVVGSMVPKSVKLADLPRNVTQQIGSVKPYKFAKLQDGKVLLVDPTNRVVVGIITSSEGTKSGTTGQSR